MEESIEVNKEQLGVEIINLKRLLGEVEKDKGIILESQGKGYTKEYMDIVKNEINEVKKTLQLLIEKTVTLLEDVSDSYIHV